jgi:hypothetical protein
MFGVRPRCRLATMFGIRPRCRCGMVARPKALEPDIVARSKDLWSGVVARPNQTINKQRTIIHFSC